MRIRAVYQISVLDVEDAHVSSDVTKLETARRLVREAMGWPPGTDLWVGGDFDRAVARPDRASICYYEVSRDPPVGCEEGT